MSQIFKTIGRWQRILHHVPPHWFVRASRPGSGVVTRQSTEVPVCARPEGQLADAQMMIHAALPVEKDH
jgi:hypothetical protein